MEIPVSFKGIVDEIVRFTDLSEDEVALRVWMESLETGWNVKRDAVHFGITPFHYDDTMTRLYAEGDGFIFDSLVFWAKPYRQQWIHHVLDRLNLYCTRSNLDASVVSVLMLGDGPGNDALYVANHGYKVDYFDVPGSKTFDFAMKRFEFYGLLNKGIRVVPDYQQCLNQEYDAVVSFEVLEHLVDPVRAIQQISEMVKTGGVALISEDFGDIVDYLPTHLRSNSVYMGKTPFLFLKNSMRLTWYSRDTFFKPYEFVKQNQVSLKDWMHLWSDSRIRGAYFLRRAKQLASVIYKVVYFGG